MEPVGSSFTDLLMSVAHVLALVGAALIGGGAGQSGTPAPGPRSLPVEMRAQGKLFVPAAPVEIARATDAGRPVFSFRLAASDAAGLEAFTTRHQGEIVELAVCGKVLAAPRVMAPIAGGRLTLTGLDAVETLGAYMVNGCP